MDVKTKVLSFKWNKWLQRPFGPFMFSLFKDGIRKEYFGKIGAYGVEWEAILFQNRHWYESPDVYKKAVSLIENYLKTHTVFDLSASLTRFYDLKKKRIQVMVHEAGDIRKQLAELYGIFTICTTYIWMTHGLEEIFAERAHELVPKYVTDDVDKFIGDASFPEKKNTAALMEEAMRRGEPAEKIAQNYGWLRVRDCFEEPFTSLDIEKQRKELSAPKEKPAVLIPEPLQPLFKQMKELVWFRTARTDVFFELLYISRQIIKKVAEFYNIPFKELRYYTIQSLIEGKPARYDLTFSGASYKGEMYISNDAIVQETIVKENDVVKGRTAYKGVVRGTVKIVCLVSELDKVKNGDILVTQMTFPSFITAMHRAAAFVTDEGGITCHAAIVSREMQKPCIVGTKFATQVFKDGDLVEVDANKGIVRKL